MLAVALLVALDQKYDVLRRLVALTRVALYGLVASALLGALTIHKARAAFEEGTNDFGADLLSIAPLLEDAHTFSFNGQKAHVSTAKSQDSLSAVLDKFEANCRANGDPDARIWNELPTAQDAELKAKDLTSLPILRRNNGKSGVVLCFVHGAKEDASASLQERLRAFVDTGDIGKVGKARYAYAAAGKHGTSIITVWTDDSFDATALEPRDGQDSPGADPTQLPRPARSTRFLVVLSDASLPLKTYGYTSHRSVKEAVDDYDAAMVGAGWQVIHPGAPGQVADGPRPMRAYSRNGLQGYAIFSTMEGGLTMIALSEATNPASMPEAHPYRDADGF